MPIDTLKVSAFRCFKEADFQFTPGINILAGVNGVGKTSVLEAVHFLSTGKSFRTHQAKHLIKSDEIAFSVFASITQKDARYQIGSQLTKSFKKTLKLNQTKIKKQTELATLLPVLSIDPSSYLFCDNSPQFRRTFLDWMVFHVKHNYIITWSQVLRCQKHINQLLKTKQVHELPVWISQYISLSQILNNERLKVFEHFKVAFSDLLELLAPNLGPCEVIYYSGWSPDSSLETVMSNDWDKNLQYGQLRHGIHKMDLLIKSNGVHVKTIFSRGQKKILALICYLSCLKVMDAHSEHKSVFCLDDFDAELDSNNASYFYEYLNSLPNQILISTVEASRYKDKEAEVFHVKH